MADKKSTFKFDTDTTQLLEDLQRPLRASSKSEVIRRALKIASTLALAEEEGAKIYILEKDKEALARVILT